MMMKIDLMKLAKYLIRHCWLPILCAVVGFAGVFAYTTAHHVDTYTAYSTLYVFNGSPNVTNYSYMSSSDINSAVRLIDTYLVVIRSNKVMDAVLDRLSEKYPNLTAQYVMNTLSMGSVSETGVLRVNCTTTDPQLSADICNDVVDIAPREIIRVVNAGSIEVIDYAEVPKAPNGSDVLKKSMTGGLAGGVLACGLLALLFLLNQRVRDTKELAEIYTVPVLAEIPRRRRESGSEHNLLLNQMSSLQLAEAFSKLRLNMNFSMVGKRRIVLVSSAVPNEGKSTISANLAISYARSGKRVLLIDGDMRRGGQSQVFRDFLPGPIQCGLSNLLIGECTEGEAIIEDIQPNLDLLPVGSAPPNPAELLGSDAMRDFLRRMESSGHYNLIVIDMPPINVVADPLVLAEENVNLLYVVRQDFSDHREIQKALTAAEMSKVDVLGMVFYGEKTSETYYGKKGHYYHKYYKNYEYTRAHDDDHDDQSKWALRADPKK